MQHASLPRLVEALQAPRVKVWLQSPGFSTCIAEVTATPLQKVESIIRAKLWGGPPAWTTFVPCFKYNSIQDTGNKAWTTSLLERKQAGLTKIWKYPDPSVLLASFNN